MSYISRPTEVLRAYLESEQGFKPRTEFSLGRLSMALEIMTVIKTLEDELVPMLTLQRNELISVLWTLLRDQGLDEPAEEWYGALTRWRQPVFSEQPVAEHEGTADVSRLLEDLIDAASSVGGGLQHARALAEGTRALHGSDQSLVPPSDELDPSPDEVAESTPSESSGSPDDTDESRAAFLRESRSRHGTGPLLNPSHFEPSPEKADPSA